MFLPWGVTGWLVLEQSGRTRTEARFGTGAKCFAPAPTTL